MVTLALLRSTPIVPLSVSSLSTAITLSLTRLHTAFTCHAHKLLLLFSQDAPWYLRPLITFPIMFGICGAAFYVVVFLNGITTDRGTAVIDDPEVAWDTANYMAQQLLRA
jgi:hypothetical protein